MKHLFIFRTIDHDLMYMYLLSIYSTKNDIMVTYIKAGKEPKTNKKTTRLSLFSPIIEIN